MRSMSCLLLLISSQLWAQCPGGSCPTPMQQYSQGRVPDYAIKSTVKVNQLIGSGSYNSGTGTIVDWDKETLTCLVLTCRHVVTSPTQPVTVRTFDGIELQAKYLGASKSGADIVALEISSLGPDGKNVIHTFTPVAKSPIQTGEAICQCGWGGGRFNQRLGRFLGRNTYSNPGGRNEGWRCHWNDTASFASIPGDSGSGIFSVDRPELLGVLWGGDNSMSKYCGVEYCLEVQELCFRRRPRSPRGPSAGGGGGGVPVMPGNPGAPGTPVIPGTPAAPATPVVADLKPVLAKVDELGVCMTKLTEATSKLADNVGGINSRLTAVEDRMAAAEKARCACSGAGHGSNSPPPATTPKDYGPDLAKVQDDLARLKQSLKASGTLTIQIDPKK